MGWAHQLLRQLRGLRRHVRGGGGLALHAAGVEALQLGCFFGRLQGGETTEVTKKKMEYWYIKIWECLGFVSSDFFSSILNLERFVNDCRMGSSFLKLIIKHHRHCLKKFWFFWAPPGWDHPSSWLPELSLGHGETGRTVSNFLWKNLQKIPKEFFHLIIEKNKICGNPNPDKKSIHQRKSIGKPSSIWTMAVSQIQSGQVQWV